MSEHEGLFVGIVCDGNRRDEIDGIRRREGIVKSKDQLSEDELQSSYTRGGERVREIIEYARGKDIGILTFWGLSNKNVEQRSHLELTVLASIFDQFLKEVEEKWMDLPENGNVRLIHMGRRDRLSVFAPTVIRRIDTIAQHTAKRTGMVVALGLDYSGVEEDRKADSYWAQSGCVGQRSNYLDLPRQGIPFRNLDLLIRTGEGDRAVHTNAYLHGYVGEETRAIFRPEYLPQYTVAMFQEGVEEYRRVEKRKGA